MTEIPLQCISILARVICFRSSEVQPEFTPDQLRFFNHFSAATGAHLSRNWQIGTHHFGGHDPRWDGNYSITDDHEQGRNQLTQRS